MKKINMLLILALLCGATANAQSTSHLPFAEVQMGVEYRGHVAMPTCGATLGLRMGDLSLGLRYRAADRSPLQEAEPLREVSLMVQHSIAVSPMLELYGGVATGFALEHLHGDKPLLDASTMQFSAELNIGLRYYIGENVSLSFNLGVGTRMGAKDWQALTSQLPYDPREQPLYATAMGGIGIGFAPKIKKLNLPDQLVVAGESPILTAYDNNM